MILHRVDLAVGANLNGVRPHIPEDLKIQQYKCKELKYILLRLLNLSHLGYMEKKAPSTTDIGMKSILWKGWKVG
jgi:hypothetical protein